MFNLVEHTYRSHLTLLLHNDLIPIVLQYASTIRGDLQSYWPLSGPPEGVFLPEDASRKVPTGGGGGGLRDFVFRDNEIFVLFPDSIQVYNWKSSGGKTLPRELLRQCAIQEGYLLAIEGEELFIKRSENVHIHQVSDLRYLSKWKLDVYNTESKLFCVCGDHVYLGNDSEAPGVDILDKKSGVLIRKMVMASPLFPTQGTIDEHRLWIGNQNGPVVEVFDLHTQKHLKSYEVKVSTCWKQYANCFLKVARYGNQLILLTQGYGIIISDLTTPSGKMPSGGEEIETTKILTIFASSLQINPQTGLLYAYRAGQFQILS